MFLYFTNFYVDFFPEDVQVQHLTRGVRTKREIEPWPIDGTSLRVPVIKFDLLTRNPSRILTRKGMIKLGTLELTSDVYKLPRPLVILLKDQKEAQ